MEEDKYAICVKNWKAELRSQVQAIVKAGKRKPFMTIVQIENNGSNDLVDTVIKECQDLKISVDHYRIPVEEINIEQFCNLLVNISCDGTWVVLPAGNFEYEDFKRAIWPAQDINGLLFDSRPKPAIVKAIKCYINSQNITPGVAKVNIKSHLLYPVVEYLVDSEWQVLVGGQADGDLVIDDNMINGEDITDLWICGLIENLLEAYGD